jgi:hypothetical protein
MLALTTFIVNADQRSALCARPHRSGPPVTLRTCESPRDACVP